MFTGVEGVGKLEAAMVVAQALNCPTLPADACGDCPTCRRIRKGEHADVRLLSPEGAGGQLKVEPVRDLVREVNFRPFEGKKRVGIINGAEKMNPTAANTLLKTLEEPAPWLVLILVTSNETAVLGTLASRCQRVRFAPLAFDEVARLLEQDHGIEREDAILLAALSGGSVRQALQLDAESIQTMRERVLDLAGKAGTKMQIAESVALADSLAKDTDLNLFVGLLCGVFRDLAAVAAGGTAMHRDIQDRLVELAQQAPARTWNRAYEASEGALKDLTQRYANKRITLGALLQRLGPA